MRTHILNYILISIFSVLLISCGGGSTQTAGIGGTGITSSGAITGFGSIFVNGVEYDTGGTTVTLDGSGVQVSDLKLGMTVTVRGTLNQDTITGSANTVMITSELEGPVGTIVENTTNNSKSFPVLGRIVIATPATVFDGSAFNYTSIAQNDVIEISGYINNSGTLLATRIEKKGTLTLGVTQIEVSGTILNASKVLSSFSFELDVSGTVLIINHTNSTDFTTLVGQTLIVKGILNNNTEIAASEINIKDSILDNQEDSDVELEGIITDYVSDSSFMVNGQRIDATTATLSPSNLVLANNVKVEVEGTLNTANTLIASDIESKTAEFQLATTVSAVTPASNTITLTYNGSTVDIIVNNKTTLEDETSNNPLTINNISIGNYLEIEALQINNNVIALSVHRIEMDDAASLKGAISAVDTSTAGEESVTILGIVYPSNSETIFKEDEGEISRSTFLTKVLNAPTVVKIKDKYVGGLDGIADEMEIDN